MIYINLLHHAVHQVSGDMALKFNKVTPADLERWARTLRALAEQMETRMKGATMPKYCVHLTRLVEEECQIYIDARDRDHAHEVAIETAFTCPLCGQNAWGKPDLAIVCGRDGLPMKDTSKLVERLDAAA
jgi:hypothetical protein